MKGGGGQKAQKGVWGPKKNFRENRPKIHENTAGNFEGRGWSKGPERDLGPRKKNFVKIGQKSVKIRLADNFKGTMHKFKPIYTNC